MTCARTTCARTAGCTNPPEAGMCFVCPYAYECPVCHQPPGSPCRRPSGHNCTIHIPRVELADRAAEELLAQQP